MITRRLAVAGLATTLVSLPRPSLSRSHSSSASTAAAGEPAIGWTARPATRSLSPGTPRKTEIWTFPELSEPVLRLKHGDELDLGLRNETSMPLALHFHGVRGPNASDGVGGLTENPTPPGQSRRYRFTPPDAGVFLIRPCVIGASAEPAERGLSAILIVEETAPPTADHDLALMIDDWLLDGAGAIAPFGGASGSSLGRLGNLLTVNGVAVPRALDFPPASRIRLRLANACNARAMRLRFEGLRPAVLAVDGHPTDTFEPLRATLPFAPGSRYDLILDMPPEPGSGGRLVALVGEGMPLIELKATGARRAARPPVAPLPPNGLLPAQIKLQNATRKDLAIRGDGTIRRDGPAPWTINGASGLPSRPPILSVKRGTPVVLALVNETPVMQPFHLHGHAFRLLHAFDDGWEPYFLDTVQVPENRTVRIAFLADNPGKWLLASTVLERFDAGLWTWLEIT